MKFLTVTFAAQVNLNFMHMPCFFCICYKLHQLTVCLSINILWHMWFFRLCNALMQPFWTYHYVNRIFYNNNGLYCADVPLGNYSLLSVSFHAGCMWQTFITGFYDDDDEDWFEDDSIGVDCWNILWVCSFPFPSFHPLSSLLLPYLY